MKINKIKPILVIKSLCLFFLLIASHFDVNAQIMAWDFSGAVGNEVTVIASTANTDLNVSEISRGAGLNASALANGYSSNDFTANGTLAQAKANNDYLTFNISAKAGMKVSLSALNANFRRSSTGPNSFLWQYSLDGFATEGIDITTVSFTSTNTNGEAQAAINLSGISGLQNVASGTVITFRLYGHGATGTGGTFALGRPTTPTNDLAISGTLDVIGGVDTSAPLVTAYSPLNGSQNTNLGITPSLTFSENIQKGTGNIIIYNLTDATNQIIAVNDASVSINANVLSIGGITFNNAKSYAIQIDATAILDLAASPNNFSGISNNSTWGFLFLLNPNAVNDAFTVLKNTTFNGTVAGNDTDPNNLPLTYSKLTDPILGSISFNSDGSFSYTPQNNYLGTQTFNYRVTNTNNYSSDATVTLNISEQSNIIISQYYEGTGVNKWIELTNTSSSPVNTASPALQLAIYSITGDAGNISFTSASTPSQKVNLNVTIPAKGSVLIGNSGNGAEVYYAIANQNDNNVINFNGNDGIALLDANNQILDAFGQGINAKDVSYVRNQNITTASNSFNVSDWTLVTIEEVQEEDDTNNPIRLGLHIPVIFSPCVAPSAAPSNLVFNNVNFTSFDISFTASAQTDEYLIIRSTQNTLGSNPVNGNNYNLGDAIGNGIVIGKTGNTNFNVTDLSFGTTYYIYIYALNNTTCTGGPLYQIASVLNGSQTTTTPPVCAAPANQPSNFTIGLYNYNFIQGSFNTTAADEYLVVMSTSTSLGAEPVNGTTYIVNQPFGNGVVIKRGAGGTFSRTGLTESTPYYFTIYALNSNCTGGPIYQLINPLRGNQTTMVQNSGALNFYYGNLHSHSSSSDGNKEDLSKGPIDNYAFAKNSDYMDFLGISEHNHTGAGMNLNKWQPGVNAAQTSSTADFTALYGMEWGTISGGGHVIVYGIDSLIGWEPSQYQIYVARGDYKGPNGLFKIVNRHGFNAIAYLAHPGTSDFNSLVGSYDAASDQAVIGSAVASGPAFSTNVTYSNPGSSMSYLGYYNRMLAAGYHIGPIIDHDNHYLTFGRTAKSRLVVMASANTKNDLLNSMKARRFYATEDYAVQLNFNINNQPMGSIITERNAPVLNVNVNNTTTSISSIKIMYGVPGSGVTPVVKSSNSNSSSFTYTDNSLANLATGYYYADVVASDGTRSISAPIWYTRDDSAPLPITLKSFTAKALGSQVNLEWTTSSERNNDYYTIERSDDGKNFAKIGQLKGAGNSQQLLDYYFVDEKPFSGVNYYRIRQTDFDGKSSLTEVKAVKILSGNDKSFNLYPNPAKHQVTLAISSTATDLEMKVSTTDGKLVYQGKGDINALNTGLNQTLGDFVRGVYLIRIFNSDEAYQSKLIKE